MTDDLDSIDRSAIVRAYLGEQEMKGLGKEFIRDFDDLSTKRDAREF